MSEHALFDAGMQPERTLLAWRRTCLSFAVAALVAARALFEPLGLLAVIAGLVVAGVAAAAYFAAAAGYRRAHASLHSREASGTDAVPLVLVTAAVLGVGALCAVFSIISALG